MHTFFCTNFVVDSSKDAFDGTCDNIVVEALCSKPKGRGFYTR